MNKPKNIPWPRILAEGAAIVVSILLAFSIEAWWQQHNEAAQEQELLQALLDDFSATKEGVHSWRAFHLSVESSTKTLLQHAISNDLPLTEGNVRRLVSGIIWFDSESRFATAALNSLVNGGDLSMIRNDTLRRLLADWPSRIVSAEVIQRQDYEFFREVLTPYLRANARLTLLATEASVRPGQSQIIFPKIETDINGESKLTQLLASEEFQNILLQKMWIQFDILRQIDEIEILLDRTITLLNDESGGL